MWKRLVAALKTKLSPSIAHKAPSTKVSGYDIAPHLSDADRRKAIATEQLNAAVRELTEGQQSVPPLAISPNEVLKHWSSQPIENIQTTQIEELAVAYFEGRNIEKDVEKAIELWEVGARRWSIESKYSFASCLRQGVSVEKDPATAFTIYKDLAQNHNHAFSHVRF